MNNLLSSRKPLLILIALLCFGSVGIALVLQHQFNMQPCPWCTMQRLAYLCIGLLALIALLFTDTVNRIIMFASILCSLTGIYMAMYQHFVAAKSECLFTWADKFMVKTGLDGLAPWLFRATASCAEANQPLFGLPFSWWSAALFALLAVLAWRVMQAKQ